MSPGPSEALGETEAEEEAGEIFLHPLRLSTGKLPAPSAGRGRRQPSRGTRLPSSLRTQRIGLPPAPARPEPRAPPAPRPHSAPRRLHTAGSPHPATRPPPPGPPGPASRPDPPRALTCASATTRRGPACPGRSFGPAARRALPASCCPPLTREAAAPAVAPAPLQHEEGVGPFCHPQRVGHQHFLGAQPHLGATRTGPARPARRKRRRRRRSGAEREGGASGAPWRAA